MIETNCSSKLFIQILSYCSVCVGCALKAKIMKEKMRGRKDAASKLNILTSATSALAPNQKW